MHGAMPYAELEDMQVMTRQDPPSIRTIAWWLRVSSLRCAAGRHVAGALRGEDQVPGRREEGAVSARPTHGVVQVFRWKAQHNIA